MLKSSMQSDLDYSVLIIGMHYDSVCCFCFLCRFEKLERLYEKKANVLHPSLRAAFGTVNARILLGPAQFLSVAV